ncbi:MAG TPA: SDR family oxidoreductase [Candidatus Acidoferrum sp.]|nr:SDR family oxidoreductase [Candidatus Acidoferrum sp.]
MPQGDIFDLRDKVAIVTGSTRGIGRAIAERYAQRGAKVVISSRDPAACEATAKAIVGAGGQAIAIAAHIGHKDQLRALVDRTMEEWGRIDVLVCSAGINPYYGPMSAISDEAFDKIINSNVRGTMWLANMALPWMAKSGGGSAIFLSSVAGISGTSVLGGYAVSKTALIGLARSLAIEWGKFGIRVNCLAPGIVKTAFAKALWENPKIAEATIARTALRRLAEPDDVAGAAVFLATRAGAYVTGQTIVIDGGMSIDAGM